MTAIALIVAAGRGSRLGGETPKQYLPLGGRAVLRRSIEVFASHPAIAATHVVIHPDDTALYDAATEGLALSRPIPGGATRQESVRLGLEALVASPPDRVLIHDAARPFAERALVDRVLAALDQAPGAIPALPVADTLKREGAGGVIAETVARAGLHRAQTPQGFRYAAILAAHRAARGRELTDDAAVLEAGGGAVRLVQGSEANFKITTAEDFARAERVLAFAAWGDLPEVRTGQGFDVHAFGSGNEVRLGGIAIPHERGLVGHSDADVGLHALVDAILGALGAGDIGMHFPPTDPRWKGVDSARFLRHVVGLVRGARGRIAHLDLTLVCERPKIGPHREAMRARIAEIAGIDIGRVAVKATTTEKLGFTGRGEGIAAIALATLRLPAAP